MIVEEPEKLMSWLSHILEPLCDADPKALAKYVLALIRKDKPIDELRILCDDQLQVFLNKETQPFCELLFRVLDNKKYLEPPDKSGIFNAGPPSAIISGLKRQEQKTDSQATSQSSTSSGTGNAHHSASASQSSSQPPASTSSSHRSTKNQSQSKSSQESSRRSRSRSRSPRPRRSRSRSPARRYPASQRDQVRRTGRNYRETRDARGGTGFPRERGEYRRGPERRRDGRRSKSRSPSRSPSTGRSRSRSHSRSRSPVKSRSRSRSPRTQRSRSRSRSASPSVDNKQRTSPSRSNNVSSSDSPHKSQKEKCRDFDEKGFCLRGDQCPFDHGVDPLVLESPSAVPGLLPTPNLSGLPLNQPHPNADEYNPEEPLINRDQQQLRRMPMMAPLNRGAAPVPPQFWRPPGPQGHPVPHGNMRGPYPGPVHMPSSHGMPPIPSNVRFSQSQAQQRPRELIGVPTTDSQNKDELAESEKTIAPSQPQHGDAPPQQQHQSYRGGYSRGRGGRGRGGWRGRGGGYRNQNPPNENPERNTLEVRKIPPDQNNIKTLIDYFSKFGTVTGVVCKYDNDPEAATVTFSRHAEAVAAHRSPDAVLSNRFIKVFWKVKELNPASAGPGPSSGGGLDSETQSAQNKIAVSAPDVITSSSQDGIDSQPGQKRSNESSQESDATSGQAQGNENKKPRLSVKDRLGIDHSKDGAAKNQPDKIEDKPKSEPVMNPHLLRKVRPVEDPIVKKERQKKERVEKLVELQNKRRAMIKDMLTKQAGYLAKIKAAQDPEEKSKLQTNLDFLKKQTSELEAKFRETSDEIKELTKVKTLEEIEKELLDAELDLYSKLQNGEATAEMRKRVDQLREEAQKRFRQQQSSLQTTNSIFTFQRNNNNEFSEQQQPPSSEASA